MEHFPLLKNYTYLEPLSESYGCDKKNPMPLDEVLSHVERTEKSIILKARDVYFDRIVALRIAMLPEKSEAVLVREFFETAASVARCRNPNVAKALDVGREGRWLFMVWEFLHGESLAQRMQSSKKRNKQEKVRLFSPVEALATMVEVAKALSFLYDFGIAHRNLNPSTVRFFSPSSVNVDEKERIMVTDIGWTWDCFCTSREELMENMKQYAAPELSNRHMMPDTRADFYALGQLWNSCLSGEVGEEDEETAHIIRSLTEMDRERRPANPQKLLSRLRSHSLFPRAKMIFGE